MNFIINTENICEENIVDKKEKVRALILTDDNKILVANYFGILLLPGGKVDKGESLEVALIRELNEELGLNYNKEELEYFLTLNFYQANYPTRNGNFCNRKITTYYYLTCFKGIELNKQKLTSSESKGKFSLALLTFEELKEKLNQVNEANPRSECFNQELKLIIDTYLERKKEKIKVIL